jgi:hypothetical protein
MTDGQPVSLSWNKALVWGLRPDFCYYQTDAGLLMWGALSNERTGLSLTIAAGPRQTSHSGVRVPWDSRPYFTVSDSRLSFSSPPTTRRATVEAFDSTSTRDTGRSFSFLSLHSLGSDRTEITVSNSSFIVAWWVCHYVATDGVSNKAIRSCQNILGSV